MDPLAHLTRQPPVAISVTSLASLLATARRELMTRWENAVREKLTTDVERCELLHTLPHFLDEVVTSLDPVGPPATVTTVVPAKVSERPALGRMMTGPFSVVALEHGEQRLRLGFSVAEVVREYGIFHETILELAEAHDYAIRPIELRVLSRAISRATAGAVSEYARARDEDLQRQAAEHVAFLAHELRNPLSSARVAHDILSKRGMVGGPAEVLGRSLTRLASLIDESLIAVRLRGKMPLRLERFAIAALVDDAIAESATDAEAKSIALVAEVPEGSMLDGDVRILRSVVTNLLRNAIKFTHEGEQVVVRVTRDVVDDLVRIEVEDTCGGIPAEKLEGVFTPFVQVGKDRSGFGLGLAIARQGVEAHGGTLSARNSERGCVFAITLSPRLPNGP